MNNWNGVGRVTKPIKCEYTRNTNRAYARFTLAVDRQKKDAGADFIPCLVWDQQAQTMEKYVMQGEIISFEGRIQSGSYTKENGEKVYTLEVVGKFGFLLPKYAKEALTQEHARQNQENSTASTGEHEQRNGEQQSDVPDGFEAVDEDVPF